MLANLQTRCKYYSIQREACSALELRGERTDGQTNGGSLARDSIVQIALYAITRQSVCP